jgi:hypothetical protein
LAQSFVEFVKAFREAIEKGAFDAAQIAFGANLVGFVPGNKVVFKLKLGDMNMFLFFGK